MAMGVPLGHESFFRKESFTKETYVFSKGFCEAKKFFVKKKKCCVNLVESRGLLIRHFI